MGMRVGGAGNSAAMAAWQAQQRQIAATATSSVSDSKRAVATQSSAEQQVATAMTALATGSTYSRMA
ncbi:MAG: hypothetical protein KGN34_10370 [Sphingomonadales bacterium]|nr:hypothetical protein [Sphingomonadales bacterium]